MITRVTDRRDTQIAALVLLCAAVGVICLKTPSIGRCGSGLYFLTRVSAGLVLLSSGPSSLQKQSVGVALSMLLNVVFFLIPALVWYWKAPRNAYVLGLLAWFGLYLIAYFLLFPVSDCP